MTRFDHTIRSDEIQEQQEMKDIDAEEQKHRSEQHGHAVIDNALWMKNSDTVFLKESRGRLCFFVKSNTAQQKLSDCN